MLYILIIVGIYILHKKFKRVQLDTRYKLKLNYCVLKPEENGSIENAEIVLNKKIDELKESVIINDVKYERIKGGIVQIVNYNDKDVRKKWILKKITKLKK